MGFSWNYLLVGIGGALFDDFERGVGRRLLASYPGRGGGRAGDSQTASC